jgi:CBS domain containing-hemolysin-like protein
MTTLILYLLLALLVSFFCSLAEAVLLSVNSAYVGAMENRQVRGAKALQQLYASLDRPLAAILSLNTVAHTIGAAGVGAQAAIVFGNQFVGLTSAVLTLLILVFSEIIPKTLGATHWKAMAPSLGIVIVWLTRLLTPLVWLSERITRLLASPEKSVWNFSRDELEAMAEIGVVEGDLDEKEFKVVKNLMRLHSLSVRDIMTPRAVIFAVSHDLTVGDFFRNHSNQPFSRIPVYSANQDDITGYVLKNDLLMAQARDEFERTMSEFVREFPAFPDMLSAFRAFDRLAHERSHILLVIDEYGDFQGVVTLEDVMETLIGLEIIDEQDRVENMQDLAHRRWKERMAALGIDTQMLDSAKG